MKSILRSFHSPKHLLPLLHTTRSLSHQFPPFSRQLHSTSLRLCSTEELGPDSPGSTGAQSTPPRWSIYGPATASLDTSSGSGEQEPEPESSRDGGDDLGREKKDRSSLNSEGKHVRGKTGYAVGDFVGVRRKGKSSRETWVCADCGYSDGQWWGTCRSCHSVGTLKKFFELKSGERHAEERAWLPQKGEERTWLPQKTEEVKSMRLQDVNRGINQQDWRIPLFGSFGSEVARVLGGGIVPGSLVLIGGDPGVGKSTLVLQMATIIAEGRDLGDSAPVVYVSGEESIEQIGHRADCMNIGAEELFLHSSTDVEDEEEERILNRRDNEEFLEALQPSTNLEYLRIWSYKGTVFPDWMISLRNLKKLEIGLCNNCERLPPLRKLPCLESLNINGMRSLKRVSNEFLGIDSSSSIDIAYPKLRSFMFYDMSGWEEWDGESITNKGEEEDDDITTA